MPNFVPVNNVKHKNLKVKEDRTFAHAKKQHMVPVVIHEFTRVAQSFPIVFVKDSETGQFRVIALLGLKPGQNLFYDDQGWQGEYVPQALLGYPFVLANDSKVEDQQILFFDEDSDRLNEKEGQALFTDDSKQTDFTSNLGNFLSELVAKQQITQAFVKDLLDQSLITSKVLEVTIANQDKYNIDGIYILDEEALNKLSDRDFLALKNKGYLPAIYAVLLSMSRVGKLVNISDKRQREEASAS